MWPAPPEGSQPLQGPIAATPPGSFRCRLLVTGGIAALNHRLMAATPPGANRLPPDGRGSFFPNAVRNLALLASWRFILPSSKYVTIGIRAPHRLGNPAKLQRRPY